MKKINILVIMLTIAFNIYAQTEDYPGQSAIGYGYDIFDKYASQESLKERVFDLSTAGEKKYSYQLPYILDITSMGNKKEYKVIEGNSLKKYSRNLTSSIGAEYEGLVFGGAVEARFGMNSSKLTNNYFYTVTDKTLIWKVYIKQARLTEARLYLDADAKKAIDSGDITKLFSTYGTHVVVSGMLGGSMDINLTKSFTSREEGLAVGATVSASYANINGTAKVDNNTNDLEEQMKKDIKIMANGGDAYYINQSILSADDANEQYNKWAAAIPNKSTLVDFEKGSLLPIWDLAPNTDRKNEIKAAFDKLLAARPLVEGNGDAIMMAGATFFIKSKTSGNYWDFAGYSTKAITKGGLGVRPKDVNNEKKQGADRFFKVIFPQNQSEYVFFQPQHTNGYITGDATQLDAIVQLMPAKLNDAAQMYKMIEVPGEENTYFLKSKVNGFYLTDGGGKAIQSKETRAENQKWVFEDANPTIEMAAPSAGKYKIKNLAGGKYFDIPGSGTEISRKNDVEVKINNYDGGQDQTIKLSNVTNNPSLFYMQPLSGLQVCEISRRSKAENAALILFDKHEFASQQFEFEYAGEPLHYRIKNQNSGLYLQVPKSAVNVNQTTIIQLSTKDDKNSVWVLEPGGVDWWAPADPVKVKIKVAFSNKYLELGGGPEKARMAGSLLNIHDNTNEADHYFTLKRSGTYSYIWLEMEAGMRLDIQGGKTNNNVRLHTAPSQTGRIQMFAIEPITETKCLIHSHNGKVLSVYEHNRSENGAPIVLWDNNYHPSQMFELIDSNTNQPIKFDGF